MAEQRNRRLRLTRNATTVHGSGESTHFAASGGWRRDVEPILAAIEGVPVVVARRTTFYGADEISVREPGGTIIGFAAFGTRD